MKHSNDKIRIKDVQSMIPNIGRTTAFRYIHHCREALHLRPEHILTVEQFAEYYGVKY